MLNELILVSRNFDLKIRREFRKKFLLFAVAVRGPRLRVCRRYELLCRIVAFEKYNCHSHIKLLLKAAISYSVGPFFLCIAFNGIEFHNFSLTSTTKLILDCISKFDGKFGPYIALKNFPLIEEKMILETNFCKQYS